MREAALMAFEKGDRTLRKTGAGQGKRRKAERAVEGDAGQGRANPQ